MAGLPCAAFVVPQGPGAAVVGGVSPIVPYTAGTSAPSADEARAGLPCESRESAAPAVVIDTTVRPSAVATKAATAIIQRRRRRSGWGGTCGSALMILPVGRVGLNPLGCGGTPEREQLQSESALQVS